MRFAPAGVASALGGSFQLLSWADVWYDGSPVLEQLPVTDGKIDFDIDQDVHGTLSLTVADADGSLSPLLPTDPLNSFGQEIHVSQAVISAGSPLAQPISVGWYRIQNSVTHQKWRRLPSGGWRSAGAQIEVTAHDRVAILADARFLAGDQPASNTTVLSEIARLVRGLVPLGNVDNTLSDRGIPKAIVYEQDRVKALAELADSIGAVIAIDSDGQLALRLPVADTATPVWTFTVGDGGSIIDYTIESTRDGVVNAVVATGEATGSDYAPVVGYAYDLDGASPTLYGGPFGRVPAFLSSPLLLTAASAGAAAATRLNTYKRGRDRVYTFDTLPNFLIELDDPVKVVLPDREIAGRVVRLTLPLTPGAMSVSVRALDSSVTSINPPTPPGPPSTGFAYAAVSVTITATVVADMTGGTGGGGSGGTPYAITTAQVSALFFGG
jgi:hypothetical protein